MWTNLCEKVKLAVKTNDENAIYRELMSLPIHLQILTSMCWVIRYL
jgi:hypothetical protein